MSDTRNAKVDKPHANFDSPHEVVTDPALSQGEKAQALHRLEQDAKQMSVAANEGMAGGEPSNLQEVLGAKEALAMPQTDQAYATVLGDLRRRLGASGDDMRAELDRAIKALEAVQHETAGRESRLTDPQAGSEAEVAEETKLEKLDP